MDVNSEQLAQYVANNSENKDINLGPPPPPKPGELIYCQWCGKPMYPEDFSKDPKIRKREFKWQIHYACEQQIWAEADRQTPGLLGERAGKINLGNNQKAFDAWLLKQTQPTNKK